LSSVNKGNEKKRAYLSSLGFLSFGQKSVKKGKKASGGIIGTCGGRGDGYKGNFWTAQTKTQLESYGDGKREPKQGYTPSDIAICRDGREQYWFTETEYSGKSSLRGGWTAESLFKSEWKGRQLKEKRKGPGKKRERRKKKTKREG